MFSSFSIIPPVLHIYVRLCVTVTRMTDKRSLGISQQLESVGYKDTLLFRLLKVKNSACLSISILVRCHRVLGFRLFNLLAPEFFLILAHSVYKM